MTSIQNIKSNSKDPLMEATLNIIVRGGIDAVRYRAVAEEAGVSLGTVSYHYKSREDLLRSALTYYLIENSANITSIKNQFNKPTLEDVATFLSEICRLDFKDKRKRVLAEYELMVFAGRDELVAASLEQYENLLIGELASSLEQMGIERPFSIAKTLSELVRGFQLKNLGNKNRDFEDFKKRIETFLLAVSKG